MANQCKFGKKYNANISEVDIHGITKSGNFVLTESIQSLDVLATVLYKNKSIFWNFKVISSSFVLGWRLKTLKENLDIKRFWVIKRIKG